MSRKAYKFSATIVLLALTAVLGACGSDKKEGNGNPASVARVDEAGCRVCHSTTLDPVTAAAIVPAFLASPHNTDAAGCQGCHGGGAQHDGIGPIPFTNPLESDRCKTCHTNVPAKAVAVNFVSNCAPCHTASGIGDPHSVRLISDLPGANDCVGCHDIAAPQHGPNLVGDNSGVRSIVPEFNKRSHHITGAAPTNAQCAVCHLEGKKGATAGTIVVDQNFHMKDAKIHLRDVDNAGAEFAWDGADHTAMDNFCFSCHDSNGASDLVTLKGLIPAATASNPFNDTLTNSYDQVARTGVADVKTAFTATNASHHAVSGKRYTYRFSTAANAAVWAARTGKPMPAASEIAEGHNDADGNPIHFDPTETMTGEFNLPTKQLVTGGFAAEPGEGEATLYEASKFVATYVPLGATQNVADNSLLHCGDCHTVGQWKPGSSTNADGSSTPVAIGAHGSANEYLLRNSLGTDAIHNSLTYVCFNCHVAGVAPGLDPAKAGFGALHPNQNKNQIMGYATAHSVSAMHIQCLADSADNIGSVRRLSASWEGDKVRVYDYFPAPGATAIAPNDGSVDPFFTGTDANSGNITGIACINCHNSGLRNNFGGIHGGNLDYIDGLNRPQKTYRFMPGMGNYRYAPPGGWDGQNHTDASLETQAKSGVGAGKAMGGCYTNNTTTENAGYSACNHHGTSTGITGGSQAALDRLRVVMPAARSTYGGGTTSTPTASEPTVREATAGNALVTRPLKY